MGRTRRAVEMADAERTRRMRERVLKVLLGVVGVLFLATAYPMVAFVW